jgi:hypothetical protein
MGLGSSQSLNPPSQITSVHPHLTHPDNTTLLGNMDKTDGAGDFPARVLSFAKHPAVFHQLRDVDY